MRLIAASLLAHVLMVAWLVVPDPLEQVVDFPPELALLDVSMPRPCFDYVWIEYRSGCVVERQAVCPSSLREVRRVVEDQVPRE